MKKLSVLLAILGLLIINSKPASASNPAELLLLGAPSPLTTIDITVDIGSLTCPALDCPTWWCEIVAYPGGTVISPSPKYYNGNLTYSFPGLTVPSGTTRIYCHWYYSGTCGQFNAVWCYITYSGQASGTIPCNPCSQ